MARKTNEAVEKEVLVRIKAEVPYSKIRAEYGIGNGTINRIKNRSDKNLEVKKPNNQTISHRRKLQEKAIERGVVKNSEIIVFGMIDALAGLNYCVENLKEINEDARDKVDETIEKLDDLLLEVKNHIHNVDVNDKGRDIGKDALVKQIYTVLGIISSYYSKQKIRVDAINALNSQFKTFMDYDLGIKALSGVKDFIKNVFHALNILPDKEYKLVRDRIIELNPEARELFIRWEEGMEQSERGIEHNNEQEPKPLPA